MSIHKEYYLIIQLIYKEFCIFDDSDNEDNDDDDDENKFKKKFINPSKQRFDDGFDSESGSNSDSEDQEKDAEQDESQDQPPIEDEPLFPDENDIFDDDDIEGMEDDDEDDDWNDNLGFNGPALETFGTDLTLLAREGKLEECFGREKELFEMMEILVRRQKNNPVLVGDAGVGKTAIIELFASRIVSNMVPFVLEGRSIVSLDMARIVAGSRYRGEFELRFQSVLDEVMSQPNIMIFIDEIHNIGGAGSAEGSIDAANILKPVLSRSGFQCIGATTTQEYQLIEKDPALNRRFQPINVPEPSVDGTVSILYGLRSSLEAFHNIELLPSAIRCAAELSDRYIYDRFLPDKAIDLIDRASAKEVIKLTNITHGSVIGSIANAGLNNIGALRMEAFRRGDIPTEYVFQEIENAYRNFLLQWVENPLEIPDDKKIDEKTDKKPSKKTSKKTNKKTKEKTNEKPRLILSPIAQELFDQMRSSILFHVDDLLFASNKPRSMVRVSKRVENLSSEQNDDTLNYMVYKFDDESLNELSLYRVSLFLFTEWAEDSDTYPYFENQRFVFSSDDESLRSQIYMFLKLEDLAMITEHTYMHLYLSRIRENVTLESPDVHLHFSIPEDFCESDIEQREEIFEILSELEERRIETFSAFLDRLKPILRRGVVESLKYSSDINLSETESLIIYDLLGYFTTDTGRAFLSNFDEPELIQRARKVGDFTGLKKRIGQAEIRTLLADMTGIPMQSMSNMDAEMLLGLETTLHERVIGQEEAISAIAKAIRRSRLGVQNPNRPIASFLFCGPTGVGKTEVTKALAVSMFGSESDMIRFDMSEFMEKFNVSRLIGSPAGYVGYGDGGELTDGVRRKPYSVVLFDEIEKGHPDILTILLQILEDGRLTDTQKRLVPFENTVIIMTSNAASDEIQQILRGAKFSLSLPEDSVSGPKESQSTKSPLSLSSLAVKHNVQMQLPSYKNSIPEPNYSYYLQRPSFVSSKTKRFVFVETKIGELSSETKIKGEVSSETNMEGKGRVHHDPYAGPIKFLASPIKENYLEDLRVQVAISMQESIVVYDEDNSISRPIIKAPTETKKADEGVDSKTLESVKAAVLQKLSSMFLPEFLNRLDDVIIFQPLRPNELRRICDIMVEGVVKRMESKQVDLTVEETVKTRLSRNGYNPAFGARPLRRLVTKHVEDLISEHLLSTAAVEGVNYVTIGINEKDEFFCENPKDVFKRKELPVASVVLFNLIKRTHEVLNESYTSNEAPLLKFAGPSVVSLPEQQKFNFFSCIETSGKEASQAKTLALPS
jgi:ATP-dependent Clp protease ATP-binding subunit ClpA